MQEEMKVWLRDIERKLMQKALLRPTITSLSPVFGSFAALRMTQ